MDKKTRAAIKHKNRNRIVLSNDLDAEIATGNAVRCLECGVVATNLTWSHFKYKCAGSVKTTTEYKVKYPNSLLVSPNARKLLGCTLERLVALYGNDEGERLWNEYRTKQAESNKFEYKAKKHGWSKDEFDQYNQSRASTITNFVARHGETDGLRMWNEYCEKQRYTASLEYFKEQWGETDGTRRYYRWLKSWIPNGKTEKELLRIVSRRFNEYHWDTQYRLPNTNAADRRFGYFYDLSCEELKLLIEFNGTHWHLDPRFYNASDTNSKGAIACEKWAQDRNKISAAVAAGYTVFVIWEHDWISDRDTVINNLHKTINESKTRKDQIS